MSESTEYESDYKSRFIPGDYLNQYFNVVDQTNHNILKFIVDTTQEYQAKINDCTVLNFGCGPCIDTVVSLAPLCKEIHMSDYLPENLAEIQAWIKSTPGAFDWKTYIQHSLQIEADSTSGPDASHITEEDITRREALLRNKITQLLVGDAAQQQPLGNNTSQHYDVISMFFCMEVAASNTDEFHAMLNNVCQLLKPGGLLIWAVTAHSDAYPVGDKFFRITVLTEDDIRQSLQDIIVTDSLKVQSFKVVEHEHVQDIYMLTAIKKS